MPRYDVTVIGLGAVGSAAIHHLAKSGKKAGKAVLGIDRYRPPHRFGSTHGETRITRVAIGEGLAYTPLAKRSNVLWRELEAATGRHLLQQCGCLFIPGASGDVHGISGAQFFSNIQAAAARYQVDGQMVSAEALQRDYPAFRVAPTDRAFLDREGGYLFVEACVEAQLAQAVRHGATLALDTRVTSFRKAPDGGLRVQFADGAEVETGRLIVTAGPWITELIAPLRGRVRVTRQVLHWFEIKSHPERFGAGAPVFIWDVDGRASAKSVIYGFPALGGPENGVKIANEVRTDEADPDNVSREVTAAETEEMYETYVKPFMPDLGPRSLRTEVCLYTNAPEGQFVVDRDPGNADVLYASACSGHGFKHSAALGEALAAMALGSEPQVDLSGFALSRLGASRMIGSASRDATARFDRI
jgi:sarcosine oxidase